MHQERKDSRSTNVTTLPTGPPTLRKALPTFCAAPAIAGPALDETLESPSEALDVACSVACLALLAASVVDELCLMAVLRMRNRDCRMAARVAIEDILSILLPREEAKRRQDLLMSEEGLGG
jgi:hypothetical protein